MTKMFRVEYFNGVISDGGYYAPGETIKHIKERCFLRDENTIALVNGNPIFDDYIVQESDDLIFKIIPRGGSARNTLLGVLAFATGGLVATAFGLAGGTVGYALTQSLVAGVLSKAWITPPQVGNTNYTQDPRNPEISAQRNEYRFNRPISVVLGNRKFAPPKAALDYSEISGNDYFYNILLCVGYGRLQISDIKIGENSLDNFSDVSVNVLEKKGMNETDNFAYFNDDIYEEAVSAKIIFDDWIVRTTQNNTEKISLDIVFPTGLVTFNNEGGRLSRSVEFFIEYKKTTEETWKDISNSMNLLLSEGITHNNKEVAEYASSQYEFVAGPGNYGWFINHSDPLFNYPPFVSGDVIQVTGTTSNDGEYTVSVASQIVPKYQNKFVKYKGIYLLKTSGSIIDESRKALMKLTKTISETPYFTITDSYTSPVRKNISFSLAEKTQYDVRIKRKTEETEDTKIKDEAHWGTLRSIEKDVEVAPDGFSYIEMRIKATDQLQGSVDTIFVRAESYLDIWTGSEWTNDISSNPAWCAIAVLKGSANPQPAADEIIDLASFKEWADWCDSNEYEFSGVLDNERSVNDILLDIASVGRACIFVKNGKWTVVQDLEQIYPKYLITPRNILKDTFSFSKSFKKKVQCLKVSFIDDDNNEDMYPVCIDGYGIPGTPDYSEDDIYPDVIEEMSIFGVKDPDQIYKLGRFWLNCNILRPFIYSWEMDIEKYNIDKGDRVLFSHDVMRFDLSRGRIKESILNESEEVIGVVVDEACNMVAGENYLFTYMNGDKTINKNVPIVTNPDNFYSLIFITPFTENIPESENYFIFGKNEVQSLIVTEIENTGDRNAKITAVDYKDEIYNLGVTPEYFSNITLQDKVIEKIPPVPEVDSIVSDESVLIKKSGALISRIAISIKQSSGNLVAPEYYQAQYRQVGSLLWENVPATDASDRIVYITDVEDEVEYQIRLRSLHEFKTSEWSSIYTHTVVGKTSPPSQVLDFNVSVVEENFVYNWSLNWEKDIDHYEIRKGETWETADFVAKSYSNKFSTNEGVTGTGTITFLIKAVDVVGNESEVATSGQVVVLAPNTPALIGQAIQNSVAIDWQDCARTFPIKKYIVKREGVVLNNHLETSFYRLLEDRAGDYEYSVIAVDYAGNESAETFITLIVGDPPGYKFLDDFTDTDFSGTLNNCLHEQNYLLFNVNTSETWQDHFVDNSFDSPQDQIDAGYPLYLNPAPASGYYENVYDIGAVVAQGTIKVSYLKERLGALADITEKVDISVSTDNISYTDFEDVTQKLIPFAFRYIKIRVTVSAPTFDYLLKLWDLRVSVGLQRIEDSSDVPVTADSALFYVETSRDFANIDNVSINVISSAPAGKAFVAYAVDITSGEPSSFKADIRFTDGDTFGDSGFPATVDFTWVAVGK